MEKERKKQSYWSHSTPGLVSLCGTWERIELDDSDTSGRLARIKELEEWGQLDEEDGGDPHKSFARILAHYSWAEGDHEDEEEKRKSVIEELEKWGESYKTRKTEDELLPRSSR